MANTKISQLPIYSGTAADLRWFVMNDSGETTTFKYSGYSSPYKVVGTNNSNNIYDTNVMGGSFSSIVGGENNTISTSRGFIGGGFNNNVSGTNGVIIGGQNNNVGGFLNAAGGSTNTNNGEFTFIYGSSNNFTNTSVGVGLGITSCSAVDYPVGVTSNTIIGSLSCSVNYVRQSGVYSSLNSSILGTDGSNRVYQSTILGGSGNTINANVYQSSIIGGSDNTITGGTFISMIGTSGRTGTASATTYVENLHTYRTPSTQVQSVSSGTTFTCNLDNGAKSQFYLTGTSTINITNVRDGASFIIKTQTNGNYNITWTATGYTFVFEGGLKDPGNTTTDLFVFEVFGSVIYGNRRHNYS